MSFYLCSIEAHHWAKVPANHTHMLPNVASNIVPNIVLNIVPNIVHNIVPNIVPNNDVRKQQKPKIQRLTFELRYRWYMYCTHLYCMEIDDIGDILHLHTSVHIYQTYVNTFEQNSKPPEERTRPDSSKYSSCLPSANHVSCTAKDPSWCPKAAGTLRGASGKGHAFASLTWMDWSKRNPRFDASILRFRGIAGTSSQLLLWNQRTNWAGT